MRKVSVSSDRTQWFVDAKPARAGVYEVNIENSKEIFCSYCDGANWHALSRFPRLAFANRRWLTGFVVTAWRGLKTPSTTRN